MKAAIFLLALTLVGAPLVAGAAQIPKPGYADPHIQTVEYDPNQTVILSGVLGFQLMLEFAPDERLENVSIGDSLGWQVTPNRKANLLFLKPIERRATNMVVVTSQRRYTFDLHVAAKGVSAARAAYVVRFLYPQAAVAVASVEPLPELPPQELNTAYMVSGSTESMPAKVFDDGRMTYFAWGPQAAVPAIFAVGSDGKESLVNHGVRNGYTVVEQLAGRFVLRNGKLVATVDNKAYGARAPAARSPR